MTTPAARSRILFVDDEPMILEGISGALWRQRSRWDMTFVNSGDKALAALHESSWDAVVTDMRMPRVDGEAILVAAARQCPGAIRVILSGQTERSVATRAMSVAHRFLSKPCAIDELRTVLTQLLGVALAMPPVVRAVVCAVATVPISPASMVELSALLRDATSTQAQIVGAIERDCGLSANLLHIASAGFFAPQRPATCIDDVVSILGLDNVRAFLDATPMHGDDETSRFMSSHNRISAELAAARIDPVHAFLCGVMHELGRLAMRLHFGAAYVAHDCGDERARFGVTHAEAGAHLVALWGLLPTVGAAIGGHGEPEPVGEIACALRCACSSGVSSQRVSERQNTSWQR
jgi:CheY-like chemotaxis protein/HD-like signal output (HDOD) protein